MSILPSSPSGMTSSETPLYKFSYYDRLQNVIARLYDTSHELCGITLAAEEHSHLLAFCYWLVALLAKLSGQSQ